ncbi:MAG: hypothetical protein JWR26_193 [Pedosphaera sp.]|nr:hypothetical protein [Pedosphaera sp.]
MADLSPLEKRQLEDLLGMSGGYVLDFTNRAFADLVKDSVRINIYDGKYATRGESKANRLRAFWECEPNVTVGKVVQELLAAWRYQNPNKADHRFDACQTIASRLLGRTVSVDPEQGFLSKNFGTISFSKLQLESTLVPILESRLRELDKALKAECPLLVVFMCGSILEGVLLGVARSNIQRFNESPASPKDKEGKVKKLHEWTLANYIDVASDLGLLGLDVKKFGHALRDFRNYIHPYEQMASRFNPDKHTAEICFQVLRAAIAALSK